MVTTENIYKSITLKSGKVVNIKYDESPLNPRKEWDNLGTMVCFHRRYDLGDSKHNYSSEYFDSFDELSKEIIKDNGECVILPLYMYEHSGVTISTTPFSCRWDSGQIGFIFVSKETIRKEYNVKRVTKSVLDRVTKCLLSEVETYDEYLKGEVFRFTIEDIAGNVIDSCGGFFGYNFKENGMLEYLDLETEEIDEVINLI